MNRIDKLINLKHNFRENFGVQKILMDVLTKQMATILHEDDIYNVAQERKRIYRNSQ